MVQNPLRGEPVPAAQVAEWAGHSVDVLLKAYAKCIDVQESVALARIEQSLLSAVRPAPAPGGNTALSPQGADLA